MATALGIDVGSTNVKVALVNEQGELLASSSRALHTRRSDDAAVQDADALWKAVLDATGEVVASERVAASGLGAIGVCSQYSSLVAVDSDARPVGDLVLYLDQRGTSHSWAVMERDPEAFEVWVERHGIPPVGGGLTLGHLLAAQVDDPERHRRTHAYLEPMDYVTARLTGRIVANQCTMFMSQLCDNRSLGALAYDAELLERSGVDPRTLPELVPVDSVVGTVLPELAEQLGIPGSTLVAAAMNDSHAGAYATGAFHDGRAGLVMGTTSVLLDTVADKATDLDHEVLAMPSPEPDTYLVWAENGLGGKALEYVLDELVFADDVLGDHRTADRYGALDEVLDTTAPGAGGAVFMPWLAGTFSPKADGRMRGGFVNLSLDVTRADLVRAVVEGTAFNTGWLLPIVERFTGTDVHELTFIGGAARSRGWAQTLADTLGRPVRRGARPDAAVAAAVASVALVRCGDSDEVTAMTGMTDTADVIEPRPEVHEQLRVPQEQFVALFEALRPVYHALNG